jgi:hypothetical protein
MTVFKGVTVPIERTCTSSPPISTGTTFTEEVWPPQPRRIIGSGAGGVRPNKYQIPTTKSSNITTQMTALRELLKRGELFIYKKPLRALQRNINNHR